MGSSRKTASITTDRAATLIAGTTAQNIGGQSGGSGRLDERVRAKPGRFVASRVPVQLTTWRDLTAVPGQLQLATSGQILVAADSRIERKRADYAWRGIQGDTDRSLPRLDPRT